MKTSTLASAAALLLALAGPAAMAQTAAEPAAPYQLSGTVTLASDYLFKGMTQTWRQPALQGSLDLSTASGFGASLWASTVSPKVYAGAHTEIDLSAGYKKTLGEDWTIGTGALYVAYPGGNYSKVRYASLPSQKYDFAELNVSLAYRWLSLKYSQAVTDLLGFNAGTGYTGSTRGSNYIDLSADIPLAQDWTLNLHAGHQHITARLASPTAGGSRNPDFQDYRAGLTTTLSTGTAIAGGVVWNSNRAFFDGTPSNLDAADTCNVGRPRLYLAVTQTF